MNENFLITFIDYVSKMFCLRNKQVYKNKIYHRDIFTTFYEQKIEMFLCT